jgi:hypothetical protein
MIERGSLLRLRRCWGCKKGMKYKRESQMKGKPWLPALMFMIEEKQ